MNTQAQCGKGWSGRCAASTGKRCTCQCGGANHGRLAREAERERQRHANFRVEQRTDAVVILRDLGPWETHPTVTNDAEWVVAQIAETLAGRRLFYYDSDGQLDELLVENGAFVGFAPGAQFDETAALETVRDIVRGADLEAVVL
jgi:hypothetical protein